MCMFTPKWVAAALLHLFSTVCRGLAVMFDHDISWSYFHSTFIHRYYFEMCKTENKQKQFEQPKPGVRKSHHHGKQTSPWRRKIETK